MLTVSEKKIDNYNFSMPVEIGEEFRAIGDVHGERNKIRWAVAAAAVLKLLELPKEEIDALVQRVMGARHFPEKLRELVAEAKAKASEPPDTDEGSGAGRDVGGGPPDRPAPYRIYRPAASGRRSDRKK